MCRNCDIETAIHRHPAGKQGNKSIEQTLAELEEKVIQPVQYIRKPFFVEAVQVTLDNIAEVAKWCDGRVYGMVIVDGPPYIKVRVKRPLAERQTKAFVGDWVLSSGNGYKVYTTSSFEKNFELVDEKRSDIRAVTEQLELIVEGLEEKFSKRNF